MLVSGVCTSCLPCYTASLRGHIRRTLGVGQLDSSMSSFWGDYFVHCCCLPCALTQESRELRDFIIGPESDGPDRETMDYGGFGSGYPLAPNDLAFDD
jgi:hypothetical protein